MARSVFAGEPVVVFDGVVKRYRRKRVLTGASFAMDPGKVHVLIGPNGAGKSTIVRLIADLARPDSGRIAVLGGAPGARPGAVGALFEEPNIYPHLSGADSLRILAGKSLREEIPTRWAETFGLGPDLLRQRGRTYSFGQRRRLTLCALVWRAPALVLLDEPTNGLDPDGTQAFRDYVGIIRAHRDATLLVTGQDLSAFDDLADSVLLLRDGQVTQFENWQSVRQSLQNVLVVRTSSASVVQAFLTEAEPSEPRVVLTQVPHGLEARGPAESLRRLMTLLMANCADVVTGVELRQADLHDVYRDVQFQAAKDS